MTKYPRQKICGIWLLIVGTAMFTLLHNHYEAPILFGIIYMVGMAFQMNSIVRKKLSVGVATALQKKWSNRGLVCLAIVSLLGFSISNGDLAIMWIYILIGVGIHFFFFIPLHGPLLGILGGIVILNGGLCLLIPLYSINAFFVSDGLIKIVIGVLLIAKSPKLKKELPSII